MVLYCSECGKKLIKGSKFCTECGAKITINDENYVFERGQSRLDKTIKKGNQIPLDEEINLENINFKKQKSIKVFVLSLVTFGIYNLICLYRWIKTLNKVKGKTVIDPTLAIVFSIITLTIATIYYDYKVVEEYELITKESGVNKTSLGNLDPPSSNLKELVLYGNIFILVASFISSGTLWVLTWFASAYLVVLIQKAVEYSLSVKAKS
tara:strand:+ start:492 stop:1118 length:627 start_codon:yes stop_codon:yes gene_type:complete